MPTKLTKHEQEKKSAASANAENAKAFVANAVLHLFAMSWLDIVLFVLAKLLSEGRVPSDLVVMRSSDGEDMLHPKNFYGLLVSSPKGVIYPLPDETKVALATATTSEAIAKAIWKCRKDEKITRRLSNNADFQWYCIRLSANPDITQDAVRKQLERLGG